jgi:hypothetical protein
MKSGRSVLSESSANNLTASERIDTDRDKGKKRCSLQVHGRVSQIPRPQSFEEEVYPILGTPPKPKPKQTEKGKGYLHSPDNTSSDPVDLLVASSDTMVRHNERLRREISSLSDKYDKEKKRAATAEALLATERSINSQLQAQLIAWRRR